MLVTTEWLAAHLNDPDMRIVESDEDVLLYDIGPHPRRAEDRLARRPERPAACATTSSREQFEALLRRSGIDDSTTVVFYGDKNNWWATYAFWVFQLFGFTNAKHARRRTR